MRCARQAATVPNLRLEIEESCLKNHSNSVQNLRKIVENRGSRGTFEVLGDPLGAKMAQDAICGASGAPFGWLLGRILAPRWAKMAPSWPTWRQDVPKMANLEAKMANLAHFWEHLGDLFWILGAILPKMAKTKKTTIVHHF